MKINRNNKLVTSGLAAIAIVGLAVGAVACLGNGDQPTSGSVEASELSGSNGATTSDATSTSRQDDGTTSSNDTITTGSSAVSSDASSDGETSASGATADAGASDSVDVSADTPETDEPTETSTPEVTTPESDTPETDTPDTDTSDVEVRPGTGTSPFRDIVINPGAVVEMTLFVGDEGDVDASVFVKESGFGGNDIVSVKFVYYVGSTKVTTAATLGRTASATRSVWGATNMFLSTGTPVSIRVTDENGVTTYHDTTVTFAAVM